MGLDPSTWHRLSEVDRDTRTATCSHCGPTDIHVKGPRTACATKQRSYYRTRREHEPIPGFVYLIRTAAGDVVKIGFTRSEPRERLRQLQVAAPYPLRLEGWFRGTTLDELDMHRRFASSRLHGEWFTFSTDMLVWAALRP